jgi:hypothetical protein
MWISHNAYEPIVFHAKGQGVSVGWTMHGEQISAGIDSALYSSLLVAALCRWQLSNGAVRGVARDGMLWGQGPGAEFHQNRGRGKPDRLLEIDDAFSTNVTRGLYRAVMVP